MAASFLHQIFHSDSSSLHDHDQPLTRGDLDTPPSSPATTQIHTIPTLLLSSEGFTSSSAMPVDERLSEPEVPRDETSSINPNSRSGKSKQTSEQSTVPFQNIHQPVTRNFWPALVLQNTGSVARDHLASERTFLAYVRTSLGMAGAGVALVQLFTMSDLVSKATGVPLPPANQRVQKFATPLGLLTLGMALIVLLVGVSRYFLIQSALPKNMFPTARLSIAFISFGLGAITVIVFGALLSGKVRHD